MLITYVFSTRRIFPDCSEFNKPFCFILLSTNPGLYSRTGQNSKALVAFSWGGVGMGKETSDKIDFFLITLISENSVSYAVLIVIY